MLGQKIVYSYFELMSSGNAVHCQGFLNCEACLSREEAALSVAVENCAWIPQLRYF